MHEINGIMKNDILHKYACFHVMKSALKKIFKLKKKNMMKMFSNYICLFDFCSYSLSEKQFDRLYVAKKQVKIFNTIFINEQNNKSKT